MVADNSQNIWNPKYIGTELNNEADSYGLETDELKEIAFVDSQLSNYQSLVDGFDDNVQVFLLDGSENGLNQITKTLENYQNLDAIHLFSHGVAGGIELGNVLLIQDNLGIYQNQLQGWGNSLNPEGDLLFYGCNVAEGTIGKEFLQDVSALTGADVAASDDLTGNVAYGGDDWRLEYSTGDIEAQSLRGNSSFTEVLGKVSFENGTLLFDSQLINSDNDLTISLSNDQKSLIIRDANNSINAGAGVNKINGDNGAVSIDLTSLNSRYNFKIDGGLGDDKVTLGTNLFLKGGDLEVVAEKITVEENVVISTGDSGNVKFTAEGDYDILDFSAFNKERTINLKSGSQILSGDITLKADLYSGNLLSMLTGFGFDFTPDTASISLTDATLKGKDINLEANVKTNASLKEALVSKIDGDGINSFWDGLGKAVANNFASSFGDLLGGEISLPLQIVHQNAKALIDIQGKTSIESKGEVEIKAETEVDSTIGANKVSPNTEGKITQGLAKLGDIVQKFSVAYSGADATAHIQIGDNVSINTDGNVNITAKADATASATAETTTEPPAGSASNKTWGVSFGLAYSNIDALTKITKGAKITSGKNINVKALGNSKTEGSAQVAIQNDGKAGITLGLGIGLGSVKAIVDGVLTAKGDGETNNEPELTFEEKTGGITEGDKITTAGIGIYANLTSEDSASATSGLGGEPGLSDDISLAEATINVAKKISSLGSNATKNTTQNNQNVGTATQQAGTSGTGGNQLSGLQGTGATAISYTNRDVLVEVGGILKSEKDISIKANQEATVQTSVESTIGDDPKNADSGNDSALALGVSIGIHNNDVQAVVKETAQLDAKQQIEIDSSLTYPWLTDPSDAQTYFDLAKDLEGTAGSFLDGKLGLTGLFLNSFTRSFGQALDQNAEDNIAVAGSINVGIYNDTSKTTIKSGAKINQDSSYHTDSQSVNINASTEMRLMNMTGIFDINLNENIISAAKGEDPWASVLNGYGAEGARKGAGGSLFIGVMDNDTFATVEDGVLIRTGKDGALNVKADADILHVSLVQGGSKGSDFALAGSIGFVFQNSNTQASLGTGVKVTGGGDVTVEAIDDTSHINVVGSVATGGGSGTVIGVSVGINNIDRDTLAYIGTPDNQAAGAKGTNIDAKNLKVNAQSDGLVVSVGVAGTKSSSQKPPQQQAAQPQNDAADVTGEDLRRLFGDDDDDDDDDGAGEDLRRLFGDDDEAINAANKSTKQKPTQEYGLGISGVVNFNRIDDNTKAFINDKATVKATKLDLIAGNDTNLIALGGSVALSLKASNDAASNKSSNGIAGAVGINTLSGETSSKIKQAKLDVGTLTQRAIRDGDIVAINAGAAGGTNNPGTQVAGSVAINIITYDTLAYTDGVTGKVKGKTILEARDGSNAPNSGDYTIGKSGSTSIWAIAGSASYSSDKGGGKASNGFGVGISYNRIKGDTKAEVKNSNFTHKGIEANATSDSDIRSITASLGVSKSSSSGGVGAAGTFSWNELSNTTTASIQNSTLNGTGDIKLTSQGKSDILAISGAIGVSVGGSQGKGIGAGVAINILRNKNKAYIDNSNIVTDGALSLTADSEGDIIAITAGIAYSGSSGGLSVAGSVVVNSVANEIAAYIRNSPLIDIKGGNVSLSATDNSVIQSVSGGVAVGKGNSIGASIAINLISNNILTYIDNSTVENAQTLTLNSTSNSQIDMLSVGGSGGQNFAFGGSLTVNFIGNSIKSYIANDSNVTVSGDIKLQAADQSITNALSGGIGIATSGTAVGAAIAVNITSNDVLAYISDSTVTSTNGSINIKATSTALVNSLAVGGSGANNFALGGAIAANILDNTVEASIKGTEETKVTANKNIELKSSQAEKVKQGNWFSKVLDFVTTPIDSEDIPKQGINSLAGGFGGSTSGAGVGASLAINVIDNEFRAFIANSTVTSDDGNILLDANLGTEINAITVGGAGGSSAGVSGSITINTINNDIFAYIDNSTVNAKGSVGVLANSDSETTLYAGTLSGGGTAGVGGTVSVNTFTNDISAYVKKSTVNAKGQYEIEVPVAETDTTSKNKIRGLAVIATNNEELNVRTANAAGGGTAAVVGAISVGVLKNDTLAYISDDSKVNQNQTGVNDKQVVQVKAFSNTDIDVKAGGLAIGGTAGIGISSDVGVVNNNTQAYIDSSIVNAQSAVDVSSFTQEKYDAVIVSGGGSGTAGVAGNVVVAVFDSTNKAYIKNSTVNSQGDLKVIANNIAIIGPDEKTNGLLLGAAGIGLGAAGVAGSVLVTVISNDTSASITDSTTNVAKTTKVEAKSKEDISTSVVTAGGGLYAGVAGSIAVNLISTTTDAYIGKSTDKNSKNSKINLDNSFATELQDVIINAENQGSIDSNVGSLGGGAVGAGVSVDVGRIANVTSAYIGDGVEANAKRQLNVTATGTQIADSGVVALAGGLVGIQGSVAVYNIGSQMAQQQLNALKARDKDGNEDSSKPTFDGEVNEQVGNASNIGRLIGSSDIAKDASSTVNSETKDRTISTSESVTKGTSAYIGKNAVINAGRVSLKAENSAKMDVKAGGFAGGLGAAVGGAVALVDVEQTTLASVGDDSQITTEGNVVINATSSVGSIKDKQTGVKAVAGGLGGIALGAAVAVGKSDNDTLAYIGNGATIKKANTVSVLANNQSNFSVEGNGAQFGAVAGGIVTADAEESGTTEAYLDNNVKIENTKKLNVKATAKHAVLAVSEASTGGIVSDSGSKPTATVSPTVKTYIGDNSNIQVNNDVEVISDVTVDGDAKAEGVSISAINAKAGASIAKVNAEPKIDTYVGANVELNANNVTVESRLGKPIEVPDTSFDPGKAVNTAQNTVTLGNKEDEDYKHGLDTGDSVVYRNGGGSDIGGLQNENSYNVIKVDDKTVKLGSEFYAAEVDVKFNTIKFSGSHGFKDEDEVIYEANGSAIGGLNSGNKYYVEVVDSSTITISNNSSDSSKIQSANLEKIDTTGTVTYINIENHGFQNNDIVNYQRRSAQFGVVEGIPKNAKDEENIFNLSNDITSNDTIQSAKHGFETNDKVIYTTTGKELGGLENRKEYYVIKVDENNFKLSTELSTSEEEAPAINITSAEINTEHKITAVGLKIQEVEQFDFTYSDDSKNTNTITLKNHGFSDNQAVVYQTDGTDLSKLTVGTTYYIKKVDNDKFQLSATKNGAAIDFGANDDNHQLIIDKLEEGVSYYVIREDENNFKLSTTKDGTALTLSKEHLSGKGFNHLFTKDDVIDLTSASTGKHNFHIDLTSKGSGDKHILSAGASATLPKQRDNKFSVYAQASAGTLLGSNATTAELDITPTMNTYVGNKASITARGNVKVNSLSSVEATGTSDSKVGGFIAGGSSEIKAYFREKNDKNDINNNTYIGSDVTIKADGNVDVTAHSDRTLNIFGDSKAAAGLTKANAIGDATVNHITKTEIKSGANIISNDTLTVRSSSNTDGNLKIEANGTAAGALANANSEIKSRGINSTNINGTLEGREVNVEAVVERLKVESRSESKGKGFIGKINATSEVDLSGSNTVVNLGSGAYLKGDEVTLDARYKTVQSNTIAEAENKAFGGKTDTTAKNIMPLTAKVETDDKSTLEVYKLDVKSDFENFNRITKATSGKALIDIGDEGVVEKYKPKPIIDFNSNVILDRREVNPVLIIDEKGDVVQRSENITISNTDTEIIVNDIDNLKVGGVNFIIPERSYMKENGLFIDRATYEVKDPAYETVQITNNSNKDLVVNDISVINVVGLPEIKYDNVNLKEDKITKEATNVSPQGPLAVNPTIVTIENNNSNSNLVLQGIIDSPHDRIELVSKGGIIGQDGHTIITRDLSLTAENGSIGTDSQRIVAQINQGYEPVTEDVPSENINLQIEAKDSVFLDLTAKQIDNNPVTVNVEKMTATQGDVNLLINQTTKTTNSSNTAVAALYEFNKIISGNDIIINAGTTSTNIKGNTDFIENTSFLDGEALTNIDGNTADIKGLLDVMTGGFINLTEVEGGLNLKQVVSANEDIQITVNETSKGEENLLLLDNAKVSAAKDITLLVGDDFQINSTAQIKSDQKVVIKADYNNGESEGSLVNIFGAIYSQRTELYTEKDFDTFNVGRIDSKTYLRSRSGNDTINVGSKYPNTDGLLENIDATLTISGGIGYDILNVDDSGDTTNNIAILNDTQINGLGMNGEIDYGSFEKLNLELGSGSDILAVESTHDGETDINTGAGNEKVYIEAIYGKTTLRSASGDDNISVSNPEQMLNDISAKLTLSGGVGSDNLSVDDSGDTTNNIAILNDTQINGLGMNGEIDYGSFEKLNLELGSGSDILAVESTHDGETDINTGAGNEKVYIEAIYGKTTLRSASGDDNISVSNPEQMLNDISAKLTLSGGVGSDNLSVDDSGDTTNNIAILNDTQINGLGMNGEIDYGSFEKLNLQLGSGSDILAVESTHDGETDINTGAGNEKVYIEAIYGKTTLRSASGDDNISVSNPEQMLNDISAKLTLSGGVGSDNLSVDDSGDTTNNIAILNDTQINGLGMNGEIDYGSFEKLNLELGSGSDILAVESTHDGETDINTGAGNEKVYIEAIYGKTTLRSASGDDNISVSNPEQMLNDISAKLTLSGGVGSDNLSVDDSGDTTNNIAILNDTQINGLGMNGEIDYGSFEKLNLQLGSGSDILAVESTHDGETDINTGAGNEKVYIEAIYGKTTLRSASGDDNISVSNPEQMLNDISAKLTLSGGVGSDNLSVDDSGDTTNNIAILNDTQINGLGMNGEIDYGSFEKLNLELGSGSDILAVESTHDGETDINTGAGNEKVYIEAIYGKTTVETGKENDRVNVEHSNLLAAVLMVDGKRWDE